MSIFQWSNNARLLERPHSVGSPYSAAVLCEFGESVILAKQDWIPGSASSAFFGHDPRNIHLVGQPRVLQLSWTMHSVEIIMVTAAGGRAQESTKVRYPLRYRHQIKNILSSFWGSDEAIFGHAEDWNRGITWNIWLPSHNSFSFHSSRPGTVIPAHKVLYNALPLQLCAATSILLLPSCPSYPLNTAKAPVQSQRHVIEGSSFTRLQLWTATWILALPMCPWHPLMTIKGRQHWFTTGSQGKPC